VSVRLSWPGREDGPIEEGGRILPVSKKDGAVGRLIEGDNLAVMRALAAEGAEFDLAYLDPPYLSGTDYAVESGGKKTAHGFGDKWSDRAAYLDMIFPRLRLVHRLLSPHGTIWVQCDHRASGLVQPLLDEIFGEDRLRNVIAWRRAPPLGRQVRSGQFPRNLDLLFAYAKGDGARWNPPKAKLPFDRKKARFDGQRWFTTAPRGDYTDESVARLESEGRIHRTETGKVYVKYFLEEIDGVLYKDKAVDAVWDDVAPLRHAPPKERTGYPTQKPEPLLARIIESTSEPGDRVLDPFGGSGTTGVISALKNRRFCLVDASASALEIAGTRLGGKGIAFDREVLDQGR
jgi:DNA modification methylase